jgi:hypothetical protein
MTDMRLGVDRSGRWPEGFARESSAQVPSRATTR